MKLEEALIEAYRLGMFESVWRLLVESEKADNGRCYEKGHQGPVPCGDKKDEKQSRPAKMADKPRRPKGRTSHPQPAEHDPQKEALVQAVSERLLRGVRASGLSNEARRQYNMIATEGLRIMPPNALSRIHQNVHEFRVYEDHAAFLEHYRQRFPTETDSPYGYFYEGQIHVDGGGTLGERAYIFIHECMHAMDGPDDELSDMDGWRRAHTREIKGANRLTVAAQDSPAEGLATFATDIYTGRLSRKAAQKHFKGCYRFLERRGLI